MTKRWRECRGRLVDRAQSTLWAQWTGVGVGTTDDRTVAFADLEAMLLGTWTFGRTDARLFDEALSWCCDWGELVHHKRLTELLERADLAEVRRVGAAWSKTVEAFAGAGWETDPGSEPDDPASHPLFLSDELRARPSPPKTDDTFASHGLDRPPFEPTRRFGEQVFDRLEALQPYCRKVFGTGARSETIATLAAIPEVLDLTTAELADITLYSQRSVQSVLHDLRDAGVLDWNPERGRSTGASLQRTFREALRRPLSGSDQSTPSGHDAFRNWGRFWVGLAGLWEAATSIARQELGDFQKKSLLRDGLEHAAQHHAVGTLHAPYDPDLTVDSFEGLVDEAQLYLDALFPNPE